MSYIIISVLFHFIGPAFFKRLLPLWSISIEWMTPYYQVESATLTTRSRATYVVFDISINRTCINSHAAKEMVLQGHKTSSVAIAVLYVYPAISFSLLVAWPSLTRRQRVGSVSLAAFLVLCVWTIDIPIHFISYIEASILESKIGAVPKWWLFNRTAAFTYHVLANGGRQFGAILICLAALIISRYRYRTRRPAQ